MCGVAGLIGHGAGSSDASLRATLDVMLDAMINRGPDGSGHFTAPGIALGMRRLAVIDLVRGNQPQFARDGNIVAFQNGEIYNYREIRSELEGGGAVFETASDTEVLAHGYDRWGIEGLLQRVDGMYAIAILDRDTRVLHLARDRFGEKPLFWCSDGVRFAYASDLRVLAALPWVDATFDDESMAQYLALHYVPGKRTIHRGVFRALPGERLEVAIDAPIPRCQRYWRLPLRASRRLSDAELEAQIERAVGSRLIADVPVGVFLSGGIDSSLVAAIAAERVPGILTFSMGFASPEHDESKHARLLADAIGSNHHHFFFDESSFAELLPLVAGALDEPLGDQASLPLFWLAREARRHATVVLSGEGADELFGGYSYYRGHAGARWSARLRHRLSNLRGVLDRIVENRSPETPSGFPMLTDRATRDALVPGYDSSSDAWERDTVSWLNQAIDPLQRAQAADIASWLPDDLLVKLDRMTMAVSLEGRAPYLTPALAESALALPHRERMLGDVSKVALRRVAARRLPASIASRRKQGFVLPMRRWIGEWFSRAGGVDAYFGARPVPCLSMPEVKTLVADDLVRGIHRERLLFALILLCEWNVAHSSRLAELRTRYAAVSR